MPGLCQAAALLFALACQAHLSHKTDRKRIGEKKRKKNKEDNDRPTVAERPTMPLAVLPEPATAVAMERSEKRRRKSKTGFDESGTSFSSTCFRV